MQWDCVKTRPVEQVDRQMTRMVGRGKHLGDPGQPQKASRHGTGLMGNCTLWTRSWKPSKMLDTALDVRLEAAELNPAQDRCACTCRDLHMDA